MAGSEAPNGVMGAHGAQGEGSCVSPGFFTVCAASPVPKRGPPWGCPPTLGHMGPCAQKALSGQASWVSLEGGHCYIHTYSLFLTHAALMGPRREPRSGSHIIQNVLLHFFPKNVIQPPSTVVRPRGFLPGVRASSPGKPLVPSVGLGHSGAEEWDQSVLVSLFLCLTLDAAGY